MVKPNLFISHSHSDWRLAERLQELIETISGQGIEVSRSSEKGAIKSGESWRDWIDDKVLRCKVAVVLLTPASFRGRWVLWEAGAVAGVQYERLKDGNPASSDPQVRRVRVLRFNLGSADLGPFSSAQVPNGLDPTDLVNFCAELLEEFEEIDTMARRKGLLSLQKEVEAFVADAHAALRYTPINLDEGVVQEWLDRLDEAKAEDNDRWIVAAKRWINIAFLGAGNADAHNKGEAVDFRIHTRLAEAHGRLGDWEGAVEQLALAAKLSPNDLVILRQLGRAYRSMKSPAKLLDILNRMEALDPAIFEIDREGIALRCAYLTTIPDWTAAEKLLDQADAGVVSADPYLANWRAIATMKVRGPAASEPHFRQLQQLLKRRGSGFWDQATLVNAALALTGAQAADEIRQLGLGSRSADDVESATRFYDEIVAAFGHSFDWRAAAGLVPAQHP